MTTEVEISRCSVVSLNAGHTRTGNPRRCFLVLHPEIGIVVAIDEGYDGGAAVITAIGKDAGTAFSSRIGAQITTTTKQYHAMLRAYESTPARLVNFHWVA